MARREDVCDTHILFDMDTCKMVKMVAAAKGLTMKALVVLALEEYIENHKEELKEVLEKLEKSGDKGNYKVVLTS